MAEIPWLARLTHPLVFFGASVAAYEGTVGTALVVGKHSETTVLLLCLSMAVVILAAMATVALLVYKKPEHLMLTQQDTIGLELLTAQRIRDAAGLLLKADPPQTATELLLLLDEIEAALTGKSE